MKRDVKYYDNRMWMISLCLICLTLLLEFLGICCFSNPLGSHFIDGLRWMLLGCSVLSGACTYGLISTWVQYQNGIEKKDECEG